MPRLNQGHTHAAGSLNPSNREELIFTDSLIQIQFKNFSAHCDDHFLPFRASFCLNLIRGCFSLRWCAFSSIHNSSTSLFPDSTNTKTHFPQVSTGKKSRKWTTTPKGQFNMSNFFFLPKKITHKNSSSKSHSTIQKYVHQNMTKKIWTKNLESFSTSSFVMKKNVVVVQFQFETLKGIHPKEDWFFSSFFSVFSRPHRAGVSYSPCGANDARPGPEAPNLWSRPRRRPARGMSQTF